MSEIRAAGGVVWRPSDRGVEVCLVHRPRYNDWSLPKGKLEPHEHPLAAAVREIAEEADVRAVPQARLRSVRYFSDGRPKVVDYWAMRAVGAGGFEPETEVDDIRWLPVEEAIGLVTYPHDVWVLREFADLPPVTAVLAVFRHARAGNRATWSGPDTARPLDPAGLVQAGQVATLAALLRPEGLWSASARRCVQTLEPLAALLDLPIEVDSHFDEPKPGQDVSECALAGAARMAELAATGRTVVISGQGKVIPGALEHLTGASDDYRTPKGEGWLLAFTTDHLTSATRL
ncbi:8-oxo-dGTP diphosphatase [Micromonospora pisi]|uniref:8-oxo-dGTP diphosphatase n=1 Tax=Micromonospora pisi TaxID=589240 RepID=A0A495JNP1_9ACTN|nr:NUDIX domain-containing protein [Micromonospora pisi]RKR90680.1 8-oxo-dGTP diphosphatase [Micromonospora pisi]